MRSFVRMLLLSLVALCLALQMAGESGARGGAEAAMRPCPSKVVLMACVSDTSSDAIAPRSTAAVDAPCLGKAIGTTWYTPAAPAAYEALAFEVAGVTWSSWSPPTPARPPRS